jgi:hypothetical protein
LGCIASLLKFEFDHASDLGRTSALRVQETRAYGPDSAANSQDEAEGERSSDRNATLAGQGTDVDARTVAPTAPQKLSDREVGTAPAHSAC